MKRILYLLVLLIPSLMAANESQQTGSWEDDITWVGDSPGYVFGNNASITINSNHIVETDLEVLLTFNNSATINIFGTLIVNGNIEVNNNLEINISESAEFIINGNLYLNNNGTLDVDGAFYVDTITGNNSNTNSITGDGVIYANSITGVDSGDFEGAIVSNPLPVSLLAFDLIINEAKVVISWTTATELNNDYFTVEHSIDGQNWDVVSYVIGAGNSNEVKSYEIIDNNPENGANYYRLKQTDFDGSYEYFPPQVIYFNNATKGSSLLSASSSNNILNIWLENSSDFTKLVIVDLSGKIVYRNDVKNSDQPQQVILSLPAYAGNILIVNISSASGSESRKVLVK